MPGTPIYNNPEFKITFICGVLKLKREFNWIGRKRIGRNKFEYFVCTPYLKIMGLTYDDALMFKWQVDHV